MMQISYGKQISIDDLENQTIDLFIFACNHEQRVYTALEALMVNNIIVNSIALCYTNDTLRTVKAPSEKVVIDTIDDIYLILDRIVNDTVTKQLNIVVDYSCMTKSWYYSIILYLTKKTIKIDTICCCFIYTPSKFSTPQKPKPNEDIAPLPGKYIVPTDKPKALIVCLGYEQNKAEGIIDHLDPKIAYIFYTDPALEPQFVTTLKENNKNILKERAQYVITYPFDDMVYLEQKLTATYHMLKEDYSVIIAPIGPKPFTLISMLMSVKYHDIDIWRVGSGSDINIYDRSPIDQHTFIINEVIFK